MTMKYLGIFLFLLPHLASAGVLPWSNQPPTVQLDDATFTGLATGRVSQFLGIPFAQPPVGDLRFQVPQLITKYSKANSTSAFNFGPACPQRSGSSSLPPTLAPQAVSYLLWINRLLAGSEDCLTINVVKPASATSRSKLPVVVWIYGGGYAIGGSSQNDGSVIVERSLAINEPIIYVSMNYRVNGFGFLASKEVKAAGAGNLGLKDQRAALHWVQKYITAFGGDPRQVTIWGESAGAVSANMHMLYNGGNTEGLFRGAFMQSGSPGSRPQPPITDGQPMYDYVVNQTGCASAQDSLACLRTVDYAPLQTAINEAGAKFALPPLGLSWGPNIDGDFLKEDPPFSLREGRYAKVPFVNGDCDDEGTIFTLGYSSVDTPDKFSNYVKSGLLPGISDANATKLLNLYPSDIAKGSPWGTEDSNNVYPQYKRISAIVGDKVFQAPRRNLLQHTASRQKVWSYMHKRFKALPDFGAAHATDLLNVYGPGDMTDVLIHFVNHLDPNGLGSSVFWPPYSIQSRKILVFNDGKIPLTIESDTFRQEGISMLMDYNAAHVITTSG